MKKYKLIFFDFNGKNPINFKRFDFLLILFIREQVHMKEFLLRQNRP